MAAHELKQALTGDSAHAPPRQIIEALSHELALRPIPGAPHTIYQELWHITFWLQITLDWCRGIETPYPVNPHDAFASYAQSSVEPWSYVCERFLRAIDKAAALTDDEKTLDHVIRCPSRPGALSRTMTVREQLESLAAHNAYHFGRIVLLRQLLGAWPPPSGGFTW